MTLPLELGGIHDPAVLRALQHIAQQFPVAATGGGGGGAPSGPAGGDLTGTYPNPSIAALTIVDGDVSASAAIAESKLALATDAAAGTGSRRTLGAGALQAAAGNDARFSDARTPTAHHTTHEPGGTDAMAVDAAAATGSLRTIGTGALQATAGNDSRLTNARTPTAHATTHQPGGTDAMAVDAVAATGSLRTLGTGAQQAAAGTDSRFPAGADIVDADVSATAAIAETKLSLATDAAAGTGSRRTLGTTATSAAAGNRGLPAAGSTGQVLTKNSATDYDVLWQTPASGTSAAQLAAAYNDVTWGGGLMGALASGTYLMWSGTVLVGTNAVGLLSGTSTAAAAFYLDPAHWTVTGLTTKLRIHFYCHVGSIAPGRSIQCGLYPVTTFANNTISVLGTLVASSDVTFTTPAVNTHQQSMGADFNVPTAGWYILGATVLAGATTASSTTQVGARLQKRHV